MKTIMLKKLRKYYSCLLMLLLTIFIAGCSTSNSTDIDNNKSSQQEVITDNETTNTLDEENNSDVISDVEVKEDTDSNNSSSNNNSVNSSNSEENDMFEGYTLIEVDGGDLSGHREPNVVVDIGFGNREYYAFTNEYGQLVKVIAKEIILQDDSTEPVTSSGRYYSDEAKVPGVESSTLDEGHIIADSLGGVSNAYNITPQNSTLNRHGDQAYMEDAIRKAGGCTDFVAIITYPDTTTQIPSHYSYTYTINGRVVNDEFDNIDPDEYNKSQGITGSTNSSTNSGSNSTSNSSQNSTSSNSGTTNNSSSSSGTVYWTPNGKSYHTTKSCPTLSRSKTILEGSISESGKSDPCDKCH